AVAALEAATTEQKPEFEDLAAYKIPLPVMLGARTQPGDAMMAEAAVEDSEELAMVPVPGLRPQVELDKTQTALMAAAEADVALPTGADRSGLAALAEPTTGGGEGVPVEMVALMPSDGGGARALEETPTKGGRPKKKDADAASRGAIRTEPKLSQKILSQWALDQERVATLSKPVKAPRFVSRTLRSAPTTVYLAGFQPEGKSIDAGRFSGTAVNFMEVRKFESAAN
ncbi:MAG: ATP/GTP-binding protein, partial [Rhizobiales bacterium]|nr:ATP/GTP-binding protein [Hyphomicrobiales bacterium]